MAVRLVAVPYRCVRSYLPSLQVVVQHFKAFSSNDEHRHTHYNIDDPDINQVVWPDPALGPFSSVDRRFPMPGNVGVVDRGESHQQALAIDPHLDPLITLPSQPEERHFAVLAHYFTKDMQRASAEQDAQQGFVPEEEVPRASDLLECAAHDCPKILRKDFADLFPDRNTMEGPFTVITLSQRTTNDMSMWSMEVEEERQSLLDTFMIGASEICDSLTKKGYWADFIDPVTGKPFKTPHQQFIC